MTNGSALQEADAAVSRLNGRVRTLGRLLAAAFAVIVLEATALLGQYVILSKVDSGVEGIGDISTVGECRTRKVIAIDQIKDNPERTPLALELLAPGTSQERRATIALRFAEDSAKIKRLQDERLACGDGQ